MQADRSTQVAQTIALLDRGMSAECQSWVTGNLQLPGKAPDQPVHDSLVELAALLYCNPPVLRFEGPSILVPADLAEIANSLEDGGLRGYAGTGATIPGTRQDTGYDAAEIVRKLCGIF